LTAASRGRYRSKAGKECAAAPQLRRITRDVTILKRQHSHALIEALRDIKDVVDVARFTPGIDIDNSGTDSIAIGVLGARRPTSRRLAAARVSAAGRSRRSATTCSTRTW